MMKPLSKIILLGLVLLSTVEARAQYTLYLSEIQIKTEEMDKFERFADKEANMASDLPITIPLYKNKDITYYTCFHLIERGKKFRLINHDYVVYNGERYKGKRQKLKYKRSENVRGRITGVSEQNIVFDPELERSVRMVFRFDLVLD